MSRKNDKDSGKDKEEEEQHVFKKKKKFDDDPIVRKYTGTGFKSFKATDDSSDFEFSKKKKEFNKDQQDYKKIDYDYSSGFKNKIPDGDEVVANKKKNVADILDEMFVKKDNVPFANVQYTNNSKHIQTGSRSHHKVVENKDDHNEFVKLKRKEHKQYKISDTTEKQHKDENIKASTNQIKYDELPSYDKKKKKITKDELFKEVFKDQVINKSNKELKANATDAPVISDDDALVLKKKEKAKKAAKINSESMEAETFKYGQPAPYGINLPEYDKKKKKIYEEETASFNLSKNLISSQHVNKEPIEAYERRKKKDYDYDVLFKEKDKTKTDDNKLRQQYLTSQAYKTSTSQVSLDSFDEQLGEVSSLSDKIENKKVQPKAKLEKSPKAKPKKAKGKPKTKPKSKIIKDDILSRLKINKNDYQLRLDRYNREKDNYPLNYYKKLNRYFDINSKEKINSKEYEILGKIMEDELVNGNIIENRDISEFLEYLNVLLDDAAIKRRLKKFEDELEANYKDNLSPIDNEHLIRSYFDLKTETLNLSELERLNKQMKEELCIKKYSIDINADSKDKRLKVNPNVTNKLIKNKDLVDKDDLSNYFGLNNQLESTTKNELDLLVNLLIGEYIDEKIDQNQQKFLDQKKIPIDDASKVKRINRFKTDLLVNYEIGKLKYSISKYFDKEEIADQDMNNLLRIMRKEVQRDIDKETDRMQNDIQRTFGLMNNELKLSKTDSNENLSKKYSIKLDQNSILERIKRFKDKIEPDYKNNLNKLNYHDRISIYFNTNLDNYSLIEIVEQLGKLMDSELKNNDINFISTDDQYLQYKKVDTNETKRDDRIKKYNLNKNKLDDNLKKLNSKNIACKYYSVNSNELNNEDIINFSNLMQYELSNDKHTDQEKIDKAKLFLKSKGIKLSQTEREKRKLNFKNEIEPELKSLIKDLDYSQLISKYFEIDNINTNQVPILKRLMDKEIREIDKKNLGEKYRLKFDSDSCNKRLKIFKDIIEPDYKNKINKLNYQDRILAYFNLETNQLENDNDLEKLGKIFQDELSNNCEQFPTDDDNYLEQLKIPTGIIDKKKRILKLKNILEKDPFESNNPLNIVKLYFNLKKLSNDNEKRLPKIMEEEQVRLNGTLIANQLKDKTDSEKLIILLNLLQLRDEIGQKLKNKNDKNLNEEVLRLEKDNANKINEIRILIEEKLKKRNKNEQDDDELIIQLKKDLDNELKQQDDLALQIRTSNIEDPNQQLNLKAKLEEQKRNLKEKRDKQLKEDAERLRKETEEKYNKELKNLEDEEKERELKAIESLERAKKEMIEKHRHDALERKKRLQEEAEKANLENLKKLDEQAKEYDEEAKKALDEEKHKLDDEYQKIKDMNKEMAKKLKKEFEEERAKIENNLILIEQKIKDLRKENEENKKSQLETKAKELETENTSKLNDEALKLEEEAKQQIKDLTEKLEKEMNDEDKKDQTDIVEKMNKKRAEKVNEINENNRKKLDAIAKKLEQEAMSSLDKLAKQIDQECQKRLEKQLEESRKEHENQLIALKNALNNLIKNVKK